MQLYDLDFADDLTLLSQTQQQMQEKTTSVAEASAAVGLNIHKGKSKILRYNAACTNPITNDGKALEDVNIFTYLGSIIDDYGGSDADVKARIGKARAAYLQLKDIWNSKQLSTNTKFRAFNTNDAVLALSSLAFTSESDPPCLLMMPPRYVNDYTCCRVSPPNVITLVYSVLYLRIFLLYSCMLRPSATGAATILVVLIWICSCT
ncbi:unnamed protein product [Schistosoma margrebowiei]|uniref:Uncharacterized protein n=1 Tax=Schistosoma margrebowiei TaxID=48269 RepID=A0A183LXK9_9TREM|nr:unnamed protein product [Schistosoma margrebowiei]